MMNLEVRKPHLDLLALIARFLKLRGAHERPRMIAGVLVDIAWDYALWSVRATLRLEGARAAVVGARRIAQHIARENAARCLQQLARRTNVSPTRMSWARNVVFR